MKYNYPKGVKCICGHNLETEVKEWLDNQETIYDEFQYAMWFYGGIICPLCNREYSIETGNMEVDGYINFEGKEDE